MNVVELAQNLIKINSVTPDGKSVYAQAGGEEKLAKWLADLLGRHGFACELDFVQPNRPNLFVKRNTPTLNKPVVALQAHLDTVDVDGMTIDPFGAEIKDGNLYGRGACDVKGPMAAMITAMLKWHQQNIESSFDLIFLATMAEETGTYGAQNFANKDHNIDLMIVGEPTMLQPVIGHKGVWRFYLETFGKASHSSTPHLGKNANELMIDSLAFVKDVVKPKFELDSDSSFSITMMHGGSTINIIPDYCRADIDSRFLDSSNIDECKLLIREKLTDVNFVELQNYPAYVPRKDSNVKQLLISALLKNGIKAKPKIEPWYSDAGPLSNVGIDTVVWGPGDIKDAHTVDEKISVDQLYRAVDIILDFLAVCEDFYGSK